MPFPMRGTTTARPLVQTARGYARCQRLGVPGSTSRCAGMLRAAVQAAARALGASSPPA